MRLPPNSELEAVDPTPESKGKITVQPVNLSNALRRMVQELGPKETLDHGPTDSPASE